MTSKLTETEIKMVIQSVIDDLGEPRAAQKWIDNKIHSIHYDQLTNGRNKENAESLADYQSIIDYFRQHFTAIVRAQSTESKLYANG
jgi:hypothetical protein